MSFPGHKTILIVDNDRAEADALAQFIGNQGHRVLIAHDTEARLDLSRKALLDIIFHGLDLPSIDGYMAARLLRNDARFKMTLLIALTPQNTTADRERASLAGFDLHISRPIDFDALNLILGRAPNA